MRQYKKFGSEVPLLKFGLARAITEIRESEDFFRSLFRNKGSLEKYKEPIALVISKNRNVETIYHPEKGRILIKFVNREKLPNGIISIMKVFNTNTYLITAEETLFPNIKKVFKNKEFKRNLDGGSSALKLLKEGEFLSRYASYSKPSRA